MRIRRSHVVLAVSLLAISLLPSSSAFLVPANDVAGFPRFYTDHIQNRKNSAAQSSMLDSVGHARSSSSTSLNAVIDLHLASAVANQYNYCLAHYPLPTQCVTSSILSGIGDVVAQFGQFQQRKSSKADDSLLLPSSTTATFSLDTDRLARFMLKGFGGGVIWSVWFGTNELWTNQLMQYPISSSNDGGGATMTEWLSSLGGGTGAAIAGKTMTSILLEQFVGAPIIYTFWDIPVPTLLNPTSDNRSIPQQVQTKLPALLIDNAKIWSFANVLVYNAPLEYRVLISSLFDIIWQSIVSAHVMTTTRPVISTPDAGLDKILLPEATTVTSERLPETGKVAV
ncbi:expressed unknown protein [Seminavis robusta]|uniref:Uncharacterized protein n=1 Tax=Seminavis robusta TaxID=568900 RepID=A0A9N8EJT5_9STRA|nr:expressed unknown protein [Seminavis robusta]|eukprot:Sro1365_g266510.1 n/a (340) ;mRNA; r:7318-8337